MDSLMEFSLDTPNNLNDNILNKKIFSLIKNDMMRGGYGNADGNSDGYIDSSYCVTLIIGVVIVIVGVVLCWFKNDWVEIKADVKNVSCTESDNCNISITYIVNSIQYSKIITINKSEVPTNSHVRIYYQESEPNVIKLYNFNYPVIGIGLIVLGIFILISSFCCSSEILSPINMSTSDTNLYSNTRKADGVSVVYTK
jgi:hypothetical protein